MSSKRMSMSDGPCIQSSQVIAMSLPSVVLRSQVLTSHKKAKRGVDMPLHKFAARAYSAGNGRLRRAVFQATNFWSGD